MERECEDEKHVGRKKFVEIVDRGGKRVNNKEVLLQAQGR